MRSKTWTILFLDIIVFSVFGVLLVLLNRWQAEINSMPSVELIRYAYASNFTAHTLFLLLAIFIGFGILATTALVSAYYISDRFGCFFLSVFADQGELLDRISVANKLLKEKDAKTMVDSNRKLREEINKLYIDVLDKIKEGLTVVKNLERKQKVADKQVKVLSFHNKGEIYVKQFEVVKELHRKD